MCAKVLTGQEELKLLLDEVASTIRKADDDVLLGITSRNCLSEEVNMVSPPCEEFIMLKCFYWPPVWSEWEGSRTTTGKPFFRNMNPAALEATSLS